MITDNYIKMCEQAEEIQKLKPYILTSTHLKGNIFICTDKESANYFWRIETLIDVGDEVGSCIYGPTKNIWLPTQEQLQEMILPIFLKMFSTTYSLNKDASFVHRMIIAEFESWINRSSPSKDKYMVMFSSMNELWFNFVMHKKYNKVWTSEKWVKETK